MSYENEESRPKCGTCRFMGGRRPNGSPTNECHRSSPTVDDNGYARWPHVDQFRDWCGEHQPVVENDDA